METVIIVIHLMVVLALVGVVLLQRSEGGGLGIGGGSGFMTARGAANALTRATAILAAAFFATSLTLSIMARYGERPTDILDRVPTTQGGGQNGEDTGGGGVLDQLGGTPTQTPAPAAPSGSDAAPAAPAPAQPAAPQVPDQ
jgi:preprotein translocase subunit SecG